MQVLILKTAREERGLRCSPAKGMQGAPCSSLICHSGCEPMDSKEIKKMYEHAHTSKSLWSEHSSVRLHTFQGSSLCLNEYSVVFCCWVFCFLGFVFFLCVYGLFVCCFLTMESSEQIELPTSKFVQACYK